MTARRFNYSASLSAAARNTERSRQRSPLEELLFNPSDSLVDKSGLVLAHWQWRFGRFGIHDCSSTTCFLPTPTHPLPPPTFTPNGAPQRFTKHLGSQSGSLAVQSGKTRQVCWGGQLDGALADDCVAGGGDGGNGQQTDSPPGTFHTLLLCQDLLRLNRCGWIYVKRVSMFAAVLFRTFVCHLHVDKSESTV